MKSTKVQELITWDKTKIPNGTLVPKKYFQKVGVKGWWIPSASKFADCMGFYLQKWGKTNPPFKGFLSSLAQ